MDKFGNITVECIYSKKKVCTGTGIGDFKCFKVFGLVDSCKRFQISWTRFILYRKYVNEIR